MLKQVTSDSEMPIVTLPELIDTTSKSHNITTVNEVDYYHTTFNKEVRN